jgi:hypothetical protein
VGEVGAGWLAGGGVVVGVRVTTGFFVVVGDGLVSVGRGNDGDTGGVEERVTCAEGGVGGGSS